MNVYGGYQNVDLKGTALGSTAKTIAGVYEALVGSNNKPILVTGLKVSTTNYNDCFVICEHATNKFYLYLPAGKIEVTSANAVKYIANA